MFPVSYRELAEVFTLVWVLPGRRASPAQPAVDPHEQVPDGLGAGDDVERRRQRAALVEVAHPQLGAGELPLDVGVVLQGESKADDVRVICCMHRLSRLADMEWIVEIFDFQIRLNQTRS